MSKRWFIGCVVVLVCAVGAARADQALFVSPSGDDAAAGTQDHPIRTLAHARDLVRALIQKGSGDITVNLSGGVYRLTEPLVLDARDSGANDHDVIYVGQPDQQVIVSGAVAVTGWKLVDPSKNLWSALAPDGVKNSRQLYIDGVRALRTRGRLPVRLTETENGYTADSDAMAKWRNPSDIEFVYTGGNAMWGTGSFALGPWTEPRCPVASIDGTNISMAQPCWKNSTKRVDLPASFHSTRKANLVGPGSVGKQPFYIENVYEFLGTPGQWYFDRAAGQIYYVPRTGEDLKTADVEMPVLEKLIDGQGTEDAPVHNIVFKHIQFSYATWLFPSSPEGFSEIQANYLVTGPEGYSRQGLADLAPGGTQPFGNWTKTPGNVAFQYDRKIQFVDDVFAHLGAAGLELGDGSQADNVQGCLFTDISGNGLALGGVDLPEASATQATADNHVQNNYFHDLPVEFHGGVAIDVGYTQRSRIEHNQINNVAYSGISLGWGGWPDKIDRPGVANNSQNVVVANNLIFDHMLLLADGGGIYTQGLTGPTLADGEKVTGNVVHDQYGSGHAIYSDNGSANMIITGNVMFRDNFDNWGTAHANYYNGGDGKSKDPFDIENNFWQQGTPDSQRDNVTIKGNHIIASMDQVPAEIMDKAGLEEPYKKLLTMQAANPSAPEAPMRVAAAAGDGFAVVTWTPPIFEGGGPVQSYTVTSSQGPQATISDADFRNLSYVKVEGLKDGEPCSFQVTATNATGTSPPSIPSGNVTPRNGTVQPPAAPSIQAVFTHDGCVSVHFMAPDSDGGSPVIAYTFSVEPGGKKFTDTGRIVVTLSGKHASFFVVDGLQAGQTYTIEERAVNVAGEGPPARSKSFTAQ